MYQLFQRGNCLHIHLTSRALVGVGRISKAVAQHPGAPLERRHDHLRQMLGPCSKHHQQLGQLVDLFLPRLQQQRAQLFCQRRAARFAGRNIGNLLLFQPGTDEGNIGGLADPFSAFHCNEFAP